MINTIRTKLVEEAVFFIAMALTAATCIYRLPDIGSIDWKVLAALFDLMLISLALEKYRLLDKIALWALESFSGNRRITAAMIATTALIAMLITNDVALLTVVPLTIIIGKKANFDPYKVIIMETAAANIGSSLTPFGNPQNLYLYEFYHVPTVQFFSITAVFAATGLALLFAINALGKGGKLKFQRELIKISNRKLLALYIVLFVLILLAIIRVLDYRVITIITILAFVIFDRRLFGKVDYFLLGTFVFFFLFVNNVTHIEFIRNTATVLLTTPVQVLATSALLSQVISNVPTAILLSPFTKEYSALLLGVSIGGLGTMVASLANLISYKLYSKEYKKDRYNRLFYPMNFMLLAILLAFGLIFIRFI